MAMLYLATARQGGRNFLLGVYKTPDEAADYVKKYDAKGGASVSFGAIEVDAEMTIEEFIDIAKKVSRERYGHSKKVDVTWAKPKKREENPVPEMPDRPGRATTYDPEETEFDRAPTVITDPSAYADTVVKKRVTSESRSLFDVFQI